MAKQNLRDRGTPGIGRSATAPRRTRAVPVSKAEPKTVEVRTVSFPPPPPAEDRTVVMIRRRIDMLAFLRPGTGAFVRTGVNSVCAEVGCRKPIALVDLLAGFADTEADTLSQCPHCRVRFQPYVQGVIVGGKVGELRFLGPKQSLHRLKGKEKLTPGQLWETDFGISALLHYGSLAKAFYRLEFDYRQPEAYPLGWPGDLLELYS